MSRRHKKWTEEEMEILKLLKRSKTSVYSKLKNISSKKKIMKDTFTQTDYEFHRNGHLWSVEEDELLLQRLVQRISINDISILHQRTYYAIICRIKKLALEDVKKSNISINDICLKYNIDENIIFKEDPLDEDIIDKINIMKL